jgi:hypothetical protein
MIALLKVSEIAGMGSPITCFILPFYAELDTYSLSARNTRMMQHSSVLLDSQLIWFCCKVLFKRVQSHVVKLCRVVYSAVQFICCLNTVEIFWVEIWKHVILGMSSALEFESIRNLLQNLELVFRLLSIKIPLHKILFSWIWRFWHLLALMNWNSMLIEST